MSYVIDLEESFGRRLALAFEELNNVGTLAPA